METIRNQPNAVIYKFADCRFDSHRLELTRADKPIAMQPQVQATLCYLIQNRDRAITRDDLLKEVWGSRIVSEATINSRISAARTAIGDRGSIQSMIRTLPRVGYRFVAEVTEERPRLNSPSPISQSNVQEIVSGGDNLDGLELTLPGNPSVAVLPIRQDTGFANDQVLAKGLTNDVITQVSRARWLFVVARGSTLKFQRGPYDPRDIGAALGVRYVVQGSLHLAGDRLRIQVELADAITNQELWAENFWRDVSEITTFQEELSELIVGMIESEIEHAERLRSRLKAPATLDAWSAYHLGCWHMYRFTPEHYDLAEASFERSLHFDSSAPRAYAGLSFVHWQRAFLEVTRDSGASIQRARSFAEESLSIDSRDPLGHWALGRAYLLEDRLDNAVDELEIAVTLNPSSAQGQYSLAYALMQVGESTRSNQIIDKARRLSPFDDMTFAMYAVRAQNLAFLGDYSTAAQYATRAASQPNAHYHITAIAAFCSMLAGDVDSARRYYARLNSFRPDYSGATYLTAFHHRKPANASLVQKTFKELSKLL